MVKSKGSELEKEGRPESNNRCGCSGSTTVDRSLPTCISVGFYLLENVAALFYKSLIPYPLTVY